MVERGAALEFVDNRAAEPALAAEIGEIAARQAVAVVSLLQMRAVRGDDRVAEIGDPGLAGAVKKNPASPGRGLKAGKRCGKAQCQSLTKSASYNTGLGKRVVCCRTAAVASGTVPGKSVWYR